MVNNMQAGPDPVEPQLPQAPAIHLGPVVGLDPQLAMLQSKRHPKISGDKGLGFRLSWRLKLAAIIGVMLVALSVYALAVYLAFAGFNSRVNNLQPLSFKGSFAFNGQDFLRPYNSQINFKGMYNPPPEYHKSAEFEGDFAGHLAGEDYSGSYSYLLKRAALQLRGQVMPVLRYRQAPLFFPLTNDQPYSATLNNDLLAFVCENTVLPKNTQAAQLYSLLRDSKPLNYWANPLSWHDGRLSTNFRGTVQPKHFEAIAQSLESMLPAGCNLGTFGITSKDAAHFKLGYSVWANSASDSVELTLIDPTLGARIDFRLALDYRAARAVIQQPQNSTNLNDVVLGLEKQYRALLSQGYNLRE